MRSEVITVSIQRRTFPKGEAPIVSIEPMITRSSQRDDLRKGDHVTPMPYYRSVTETVPAMLTGTNWQTEQCSHYGPMSVTVAHLATGLSGPSTHRGKAATRALVAAKNQQVNLAMALVTARQSIRLVKDSASTIVDIMKAVVARDFRGVLRAAGHRAGSTSEVRKAIDAYHSRRNVSSKYLATVFGVFPLLKDIEGGMSYLSDNGLHLEVIAKGSSGADKTVVETLSSVPWRSWAYGNVGVPAYGPRQVTTTTVNDSSRCALRYALDLVELQRAASLGFTNPLLLLWDALSLSFVLDWAINVSQFLSALDSTVGLQFVSGVYSDRRVSETTVALDPYTLSENVGVPPVKKLLVKASYSPAVTRTVYVYREIITSSPRPTLHFKNPLSLFSVAATAALLGQAIGVKRDAKRIERAFRYRPPRPSNLPAISYRP